MSAATDQQQQAVDRAIELMRKDLTAELPIADLALAVGYSQWHLTRLFNHITGTSPNRYRTRLRMAEARRLLADTDLPVSTIVGAVGYDSVGTFGSMFKAHVGCPPSVYRRRARNAEVVAS